MKREIKFRVWCNYHKDWEKHDVFITLDGRILHDTNMADYGKDHIVEQFTGLLDKNKKEIYEGDIIECEYHGNLPSTRDLKHLTWKGIVEYGSDASFHVFRKTNLEDQAGSTYAVRVGGSAIKRYEVIGNIHENPELLK